MRGWTSMYRMLRTKTLQPTRNDASVKDSMMAASFATFSIASNKLPTRATAFCHHRSPRLHPTPCRSRTAEA